MRRISLVATSVLGLVIGTHAVRAADLSGSPSNAPLVGVPCESPEVTVFPSVWLGHFSGGSSYYPGPGQSIVLDWRDEKLCFPTRGSCGRFIAAMRRDFHRPEGYFTCLPIR